MAVIEISKIQVRRGQENQTGVPVLAGGEFAWAADTENLYIGLRKEDGGSRDANVRILTENDLNNFFETVNDDSPYIYRELSGITTSSSYPAGIERSVKSKLDDIVNILDFGVLGDFINDDTASFNFAIEQLYISTSSQYALPGGIRQHKKLLIPAGNYKISSTIFLPNNAYLIGEGKDKTIITLNGAGQYTHLFQTVDPKVLVEADEVSINGPYGNFDDTDSRESMTNTNVQIESMTLSYLNGLDITNVSSLISLDISANSVIRDVKFQGAYNITSGITATNYSAITLRGLPLKSSDNVLIDNCEFQNLYFGIGSNHDISNAKISNCTFKDLNRGVVFNNPVSADASVGPKNCKITNNRFEKIFTQAIYMGTSSSITSYSANNISANNQFIDVGNLGAISTLTDISLTGTSVISFLSKGNVSLDDYIGRRETQLIKGGSGKYYNPLIEGRASIENNSAELFSISGFSQQSVFRLPITKYPQHAEIKYNVTGSAPLVDRQGIINLYVKNSTSSTNPEVVMDDNYNYSSSEGLMQWVSTVSSVYKWIELSLVNSSGGIYSLEYQSKVLV